MPTLSITINCDGAALSDLLLLDLYPDRELTDFTAALVLDAVDLTSTGTVRDENGNTVGNWTFAPDTDTDTPTTEEDTA